MPLSGVGRAQGRQPTRLTRLPWTPRWAKDTKLLTWLENCYPAVGTKRAAVDEFLAGIADAQLDDWDPMKFVRPIGERERETER